MQADQARLLWLGLAASPYFSLALLDGWMHERSRRVPRTEQALHAGIFLSLAAFFAGAFLARDTLAVAGICCFAALYGVDEFGFHRGIGALERRIHAVATLALLGFVLFWRFVDPR